MMYPPPNIYYGNRPPTNAYFTMGMGVDREAMSHWWLWVGSGLFGILWPGFGLIKKGKTGIMLTQVISVAALAFGLYGVAKNSGYI